ncbi:MAG: Gfo/Idh/MocA family oxidoreductase [Candidatus Omnitrophica bacterium]|nr:Gfo/Idh/MocA family oxidoreductase [Candidatus Omnitrophota bacterium]MDD5236355.1 Gfo/Idh/MocA family oxidoreductase [Candidatus Omnitrophota bacterium]MDD5610217.1 Gfo/Idh/MocA family oxidoreductase [Candidatus Omnitrophota bacterium]
MDKVRIAVIGTGHLGSIHARIYKNLHQCELVGVSDIDAARLKDVARAFHAQPYPDYHGLFGKVDAVSIAVPTKLHYPVAKEFLEQGIHTLVEKPFTTELKDADALIDIAESKDLILQVGHVERFNSAFNATLKIIKEPKFIECHRLSPFPNRSLDVGVVLDLMIHDIDIILGLLNAKIKSIEAVGINVLTPFEDIANARLTFENGCVANLTSSRVSDDILRKIRIFQENTYISLDYKEAKARVYRKNGLEISKENLPIEKEEPLKKELESFIACVSGHQTPIVSGKVARDALAVALEIQNQIWKNRS